MTPVIDLSVWDTIAIIPCLKLLLGDTLSATTIESQTQRDRHPLTMDKVSHFRHHPKEFSIGNVRLVQLYDLQALYDTLATDTRKQVDQTDLTPFITDDLDWLYTFELKACRSLFENELFHPRTLVYPYSEKGDRHFNTKNLRANPESLHNKKISYVYYLADALQREKEQKVLQFQVSELQPQTPPVEQVLNIHTHDLGETSYDAAIAKMTRVDIKEALNFLYAPFHTTAEIANYATSIGFQMQKQTLHRWRNSQSPELLPFWALYFAELVLDTLPKAQRKSYQNYPLTAWIDDDTAESIQAIDLELIQQALLSPTPPQKAYRELGQTHGIFLANYRTGRQSIGTLKIYHLIKITDILMDVLY